MVVAGYEMDKVGKGGTSRKDRTWKPAKWVQVDVVHEDSNWIGGQLDKV